MIRGGGGVTEARVIELAQACVGPGAAVAWGDIEDKPVTYDPAAHVHLIAEITGLQPALDGKQPAGSYAAGTHAHLIAEITGLEAALGAKADTGHSHTIANVTGLQGALDGKQAAGSYALASHNHDAAYAALSHTQAISTVTGLQAALDAKAALAGAVFAGAIGYSAPGAVTQQTNKTTAVTLNALTGQITLAAGALAAGAVVTFTLNNNQITASDLIVCSHHSGGTVGPYLLNMRATGAGTASCAVRNTSAGSLNEQPVIKFAVIRA